MDKFDEILQNLKSIQKMLTDSVIFLPDYEVKHAQGCLQKLQNEVNQRQDELMPRKKFTFTSRTKNATNIAKEEEIGKNGEETTDGNERKTEVEKTMLVTGNDFGFCNKNDTELFMSRDECKQKDIKLSNLENCTVKLYGCLSALHISNLKKCDIFVGPLSTASFISECTDCSFSLACQQVRIHTTKDSVFNIHVTGKAIIEDCKNVGFAPYNWSYQNISDDFKDSKLRLDINKWNDVDDFNWLSSNEASPNWYIVPEDNRTSVDDSK